MTEGKIAAALPRERQPLLPSPPPTSYRARYPDVTGFVERDGVRIHWEQYGDGGRTVVLLPTWSNRPLTLLEGTDPLPGEAFPHRRRSTAVATGAHTARPVPPRMRPGNSRPTRWP